ncbi:hypothetical protein SEA_MUSETTA_64 [Microbacterium phage Musetta]|nr:hypothetical protein SEA_LYELL_64 [Microbacterium phage Lyell]AXC36286.1 hypothetical protein SEA_FORK_60 [Microbacterium phage Fork]AXH50220.1 hypothetical protein SEA_MUSETTA_64 [Microbacterium phage Musetta]QWS69429.1 membrane protein [Microbacterium phage Necrophoxinus]QYC54183.1 hypothetical protein SEA_WELCOME_65 [Microbacterium phage Welcome]URM87467.1 membrane protein [Microbacterium phage DustyDino]UVK62478.1 membrane protein [Microbacterium phage Yuma]WMI33935.1 hypothetical pro
MSTPIFDNVTRDTVGEPTLEPVRKVKFAALWGGLAVIATAALTAVTPDMLSFAGQFTPVIYAAVVGLASVIGAYVAKPE